MVGTTPYYKMWTLTPETYMPLNNIIYTFNYFVPDDWAIKKTSKVTQYGYGRYTCKTLYPGFVS